MLPWQPYEYVTTGTICVDISLGPIDKPWVISTYTSSTADVLPCFIYYIYCMFEVIIISKLVKVFEYKYNFKYFFLSENIKFVSNVD